MIARLLQENQVFTYLCRFIYAKGVCERKQDENILKKAGNAPDAVFHDQGNEWKGKFAKLCGAINISSLQNDLGDHRSLGIIDRFLRTIKTMIQEYLTSNNTTKCIDELPRLIQLYNNTPR